MIWQATWSWLSANTSASTITVSPTTRLIANRPPSISGESRAITTRCRPSFGSSDIALQVSLFVALYTAICHSPDEQSARSFYGSIGWMQFRVSWRRLGRFWCPEQPRVVSVIRVLLQQPADNSGANLSLLGYPH